MPAGRRTVSLLDDCIVEAIASRGYYVGASVIDADLVVALRTRLRALHAQHRFHAAQVGRAATRMPAPLLRGDSIAWLDPDALEPAEAQAMQRIDSLRDALNKALYIGAMDTECHFSRYPRGAFYKTHLDRFGDHDLRVVSLVFYLNERWQDHQGGELLIHDVSRNTIERVLPRSGTMVAFLSAVFRMRYCLPAEPDFPTAGCVDAPGRPVALGPDAPRRSPAEFPTRGTRKKGLHRCSPCSF